MRNPIRITALAIGLGAALLLLATPALATDFYNPFEDVNDANTGTGVARVYLPDGTIAIIYYYDTDGSGTYSPGDLRRITRYIRPAQPQG